MLQQHSDTCKLEPKYICKLKQPNYNGDPRRIHILWRGKLKSTKSGVNISHSSGNDAIDNTPRSSSPACALSAAFSLFVLLLWSSCKDVNCYRICQVEIHC